jgi:hypothetical protein
MSGPPPWDFHVQPPDIALFIALGEEFRELGRSLSEGWYVHANATYGGYDYLWLDPISGYGCAATFAGRMGTEEATHYTNRLLMWQPAAIVNIGIAGGCTMT